MAAPAHDGPTPRTLFDRDPFTGFGPSRFCPADAVPEGRRFRGKSQATFLKAVKAHAPKRSGVYGMLDAKGRVIYIGKAKSLRCRLMSYFRSGRDPKAGRILGHTRTLLWEHTADEFAALLRELELIRRFRPRFNVLGQPGPRRYVYLCLGKGPAPYAYLTREPGGKEVASYGPLVGKMRVVEAVRRLNDWFRLRDCPATIPMCFADQPELFPDDRAAKCLRFDIGNCAGPCAGLCSRKEYGANVRAAKAFLDGRDHAPLKELKARMTAAAVALKFEQATALRDRLQSLQVLDDRLTFLRQARRGGSFVYPLAGHDGGTVWYLIHRGQVAAALREPTDDAARLAVLQTIDDLSAAPSPANPITDHTVDSVLLVHAWFRQRPDQKARLLKWTDLRGVVPVEAA